MPIRRGAQLALPRSAEQVPARAIKARSPNWWHKNHDAAPYSARRRVRQYTKRSTTFFGPLGKSPLGPGVDQGFHRGRSSLFRMQKATKKTSVNLVQT